MTKDQIRLNLSKATQKALKPVKDRMHSEDMSIHYILRTSGERQGFYLPAPKSAEEAVTHIHQNGHVLRWADVRLYGVNPDKIYIELVCSPDRVFDDIEPEHKNSGHHPFRVQPLEGEVKEIYIFKECLGCGYVEREMKKERENIQPLKQRKGMLALN